MNKGTVLALLVVVLGGGIGIGKMLTKDKDGSASAATAKTGTTADREERSARRRATASTASACRPRARRRGRPNAKVTIVEFSDFQCPFCSRVDPDARADREGRTATTSASSSGTTRCRSTRTRRWPPRRPWPPRRRASSGRCTTSCSPTSRTLERPDLEKYAQEIGLDVGKFKAALDSDAGKARDRRRPGASAKQVGAHGTPNFYIDGRNVSGAQPFDEFKKVIDDELASAPTS